MACVRVGGRQRRSASFGREGYGQPALDETQGNIRREPLHVGIFAHQLRHEKVVGLRVRGRNDKDEIGFASDVEGLLDMLLGSEPAPKLDQEFRTLALDLKRNDEKGRPTDLGWVDHRSVPEDHAIGAHSPDPALDRRGRQRDMLGKLLGTPADIGLNQVKQLPVELIKVHT